MLSAYLEQSPARVEATRLLGRVSRRAYFGPLAPLRVRQVGRGRLPGQRWVRVRNTLAGIAEDDVERVRLQVDASVSLQAPPHPHRQFLGREVTGEVVEVGSDVQFLRVGDRVAYQLDQCCATRGVEPLCRQCAVGAYNLCENRYLPGPEGVGGGWSEEMTVHEGQLFLVPDSLSDEQAALIEPAAVAAHAALRYRTQPGDQALVIGAEPMGLLTIQALRALAPNVAVTAYPYHQHQVENATRMGAVRILYPDDSVGGVARLTNAKTYTNRHGAEMVVGGFDVVYDTVGNGASLQSALRWAREGGVVVLVGKRQVPLHLDLTPIWNQEITLLGALAHGAENWPGGDSFAALGGEGGGRVGTFALAAALMREGRLTPERLITHRFPLREVRRALETARDSVERRAIKVMLDIHTTADAANRDAELAPEAITSW